MKKKWWVIVLIIVILITSGVIAWWLLTKDVEELLPGGGFGEGGNTSEPIYSNLTGLEISDESLNQSPTFCVQIPNGSTDGARPQAGLNQAAVVFEAIAETGITRFAAIFQNPSTGVIGPIRSLRPYYLDWDTPFDCTVVHDGGSAEALAVVSNGRYRNLDENFDYMWKVNDPRRLWNNVFTSPDKLLNFNRDNNYLSSNPRTFVRFEPTELADLGSQATQCPEEAEECSTPNQATNIRTVFTNLSDYIVNYSYDATQNNYRRSYEGTGPHLTYACPANVTDLAQCGDPIQVTPNVLIVMRVQEHTMSDNYHESIQTIGEGIAYIFQNGTVTEGTWKKSSQDSQIQFHDLEGSIIKLVPGQVWISAVPQFGSVNWQ